ncbi:MAG: hypothetical protein Q4E64_08520 [Phascolarctobacterium sp.]|uniref:hypothetical protein n=1 Tax=Phascolarctobacterium sp. TaxID=2049039 RepID=UPI0026DDB0E4|nr:hypothetical protein [Phascolarctobacterium sp.]MDO4921849.1 hypothetical protein [Phascolarctobacterium sp.]
MKKRNIFSLLITLLLCCLATAAMAAKSDWKNAQGSYVWTESSQYNNGILNIKPLEDDIYLFEFKVMRGSEAEDSAEEFQTAGTLLLNDDGVGEADVLVGEDDSVIIQFALANKTMTVKQTGKLPLDIQGDYQFNEPTFDVSENAAVAIIESLPANLTSLSAANRPYRLLYADETVDGWFYQVIAVHEPTNSIIAKYLVAADLNAVYRNDAEEPGLIYGTPESMLAAKRVPLVEEEQDNPPYVENGELQGNTEEEDQPAVNEAQATPLVKIAAEQESLRAGESTKIVAELPGNLGYTVANLQSSNKDVLKIDGDKIVGVAPGTATVTGTLNIEKGKKKFAVRVTVFEPRLEVYNMPTHINIGDKLSLQAFITGEEGDVKAQWSVNNEKIAVIEKNKLVGKADGLVTVTAKRGDMQSSWFVAVGKAELPMGAIDGDDDDDYSWMTGMLAAFIGGIVAIAGGALWFFKRRK